MQQKNPCKFNGVCIVETLKNLLSTDRSVAETNYCQFTKPSYKYYYSFNTVAFVKLN